VIRGLVEVAKARAMKGALRLAARRVKIDHEVASRLKVPPHWDRGAVTVLVIGVDTRSRLRRRYKTIPQGELVGSSADSILVVVVDAPSNAIRVITVPRSLGVELPDLGYQRLGWARQYGGSSSLVTAVAAALGIDIHHYIELGFRAFAGLVDAIGGVEFDVPAPIRDWRAGVDLSEGYQRLDGPAALGLVRSRQHTVESGGHMESRNIGEDGRSRNVAEMTHALAVQMSRAVNPTIAARIALKTIRDISVDPILAGRDWLPLVNMIRVMDFEFHSLPVSPLIPASELRSPFPPFQSSGSQYLQLAQPQAINLLQSLSPLSKEARDGPTH